MESTPLIVPAVAQRLRINWGPVLAGTLLAAIAIMIAAALMRSPLNGVPQGEVSDPVSILWALPFALLLASIAAMPFIHKHWWEKFYPAVSLALAAIAAAGYCLV